MIQSGLSIYNLPNLDIMASRSFALHLLLLKYEETVHPAVYALADVACKKDTHIELKGTVMDELIKD